MRTRVTRRGLLNLALGSGLGGALGGLALPARSARPAWAAGSAQEDLVVAFTVDIQSLDGRLVFSTDGVSMTNHVYEPLITFDVKGNLQPKLAERWTFPDPRTIRFGLRRNVKFHNGEPFDAQAVKYTLESIVAPGSPSPQRSFLDLIDHVDVVDPLTADVKLKNPGARSILRTLTYWGRIMPPRFSADSGAHFSQAIGTGPYKMAEYHPGERFVVERNPQYWGPPPQAPRIVFRIIPEDGTRVAALERGEIDIAMSYPIDQIPNLRRNASLTFEAKPTVRIAVVGFKVDRPPLNDVRVRRALAMVINRAQINEQLLGGFGRVANGLLTPEIFGYSSASQPPAYDPAQGQRLLASSGHEGFRMQLGISNARFISDRAIGETVGAYFGEAGVQVALDAPEFGTFIREVFKSDSKYDAYLLSWATNTLDADFGLTTPFDQRIDTLTNYKNPEVSQLLADARATVDEKQAVSLYQRVQAILMSDLPWIPIVQVPVVVGMSRRVRGVQLRPDELIFFWNVGKS